MKREIPIPEIGESISSGVLTLWLKGDGDYVEEGEDLFELETDKATLAVPSPASGNLSILVAQDTEVKVGQVVASLELAEQRIMVEAPPAEETDEHLLSPAARRIVAENRLDPTDLKGTGKDGRILKEDALAALEAQGSPSAKAEERPPAQVDLPTPGAGRVEKRPAGGPPPAGGERRQVRRKMSTLRRRIAERLVEAKGHAAHLTTFNEINMSEVMSLRREFRDSFQEKYGVKLGFMSFFVKACCQALTAFPDVNAFIEGDEIIENHYYDIGIAVSTERGLVVPVLRDADTKSFAEIETEIASFAVRAREKKLTVNELTGGTFSITNGGVFGSLLSTPIPNPPQTAILGMHAIQNRPVAAAGTPLAGTPLGGTSAGGSAVDRIVLAPMMYVALTYDHRVIDGRDAVTFLRTVKELVEDPRRMLLQL
jgi:2-oxoglutarate dehydrogenase E2 component (dihydrolipoamide succinyltransferase)